MLISRMGETCWSEVSGESALGAGKKSGRAEGFHRDVEGQLFGMYLAWKVYTELIVIKTLRLPVFRPPLVCRFAFDRSVNNKVRLVWHEVKISNSVAKPRPTLPHTGVHCGSVTSALPAFDLLGKHVRNMPKGR